MSWLEPYADVECCYVTTTGRRTGQRHEIEIWFGLVDDTMYLISGNGPTADWFRNLQVDPIVTVRVGDVRRQGRARVVSERPGSPIRANGPVRERTGSVVTDEDERRRVGDVMGAKYVWGGDPSIGLTYSSWCYDVPAAAIEFPERQ